MKCARRISIMLTFDALVAGNINPEKALLKLSLQLSSR